MPGDVFPPGHHRDIWIRLGQVGDGAKPLQQRYYSTFAALANKLSPERVNQAAHSARYLAPEFYKLVTAEAWPGQHEAWPYLETFCEADTGSLSKLIGELLRLRSYYRKASRVARSRYLELIRALHPGVQEAAAKSSAAFLSDSNGRLHSLAHFGVGTENDLLDALRPLEELMLDWRQEFFEAQPGLDAALANPDPSPRDLESIRTPLLDQSRLAHFFAKLTHVKWLPLLIEKDYFAIPPALNVDKDGGKSAPPWPQLAFLRRCCEAYPDEAAEIVREHATTSNWNVARDLAEVLGALPIKEAAGLVGATTKALLNNHRGGLIPEIFGKLCIRLADESDDTSEALTRQLLTVLSDDKGTITCVVDADTQAAWMYDRVARAIVPRMSEAHPAAVVGKLNQQLKLWVWKEYPGSRDDPTGDYSHYKRLKIGADSDQYGETLLHTLVDCLVKALMTAQNSDDSVDRVFGIIRKARLPIFHRIEMYVMSDKPSKHLDRIAELVSDPKIVRNPVLDIELGGLLEKSLPQLALAAREAYLQIVEQGPADPEEH
jgi:hypothetical protein